MGSNVLIDNGKNVGDMNEEGMKKGVEIDETKIKEDEKREEAKEMSAEQKAEITPISAAGWRNIHHPDGRILDQLEISSGRRVAIVRTSG
jgi:hypothetical protein